MKAFIKALLLGAALSVPLVFSNTTRADDYWTNHWNWYDNTYRPYYYRAPAYGSYYGPGYYNNYYGPGYGGYGYGSYGYGNYGGYGTPYRSYSGTSNFGYGRTRGGGQAVNIGGLRFGWR